MQTPQTLNEKMQFRDGADVLTLDGEKIGQLDRVIIDPHSKTITHLVVREGFLLTEDTVLPVEMVGAAEADGIRLRQPARNLESLPRFEEKHYVPIRKRVMQTEFPAPYPAGYAGAVYYNPPVGGSYPTLGRPTVIPPAPQTEVVTRQVPKGKVSLKEGAKVLDRLGEHVGDVERLFMDDDNNQATHILITRGLLFKEHKLIPTLWIDEITDDSVRVAVSAQLLDSLPDYQDA